MKDNGTQDWNWVTVSHTNTAPSVHIYDFIAAQKVKGYQWRLKVRQGVSGAQAAVQGHSAVVAWAGATVPETEVPVPVSVPVPVRRRAQFLQLLLLAALQLLKAATQHRQLTLVLLILIGGGRRGIS